MSEPVPACPHDAPAGGVCELCKEVVRVDPADCSHDVILNGRCYYCGSDDLDGEALSPKRPAEIVPVDRLRKPR